MVSKLRSDPSQGQGDQHGKKKREEREETPRLKLGNCGRENGFLPLRIQFLSKRCETLGTTSRNLQEAPKAKKYVFE